MIRMSNNPRFVVSSTRIFGFFYSWHSNSNSIVHFHCEEHYPIYLDKLDFPNFLVGDLHEFLVRAVIESGTNFYIRNDERFHEEPSN